MEFGNKSRFGASLQLLEDYKGAWLFGHFCFWIADSPVGNYEAVTSLRDVFTQMHYHVKDCGKRSDPSLCDATADELFWNLDFSLYSHDDELQCRKIHLPEDTARFDIRIPVDVFDQWRIYLIDCATFSRVLFKRPNEERVLERHLCFGEYDAVIHDVYFELERLWQREQVFG